MTSNLAMRVLAAIEQDRVRAEGGASQAAADIVRRCDADRQTVRRHVSRLDSIGLVCKTCHHTDYPARYPCLELLDRAAAYGVPVVVEPGRGGVTR